jgi:HEAT repeat protein
MHNYLIWRIMTLAMTVIFAAIFPAGAITSSSTSTYQVNLSTGPDLRTNLEKMSDPNPLIRRNAAIYLGSERKKENIPFLIKALEDENVEVRRAGVNALANSQDSQVVAPLIEKFKSEKNLSVKLNIIMAFGTLRSDKAVSLLVSELKNPYPGIRNEVVKSLGNINNKTTYKDIAAMLGDEAESVKVIAAEVAGNLKIREAVPGLLKNLADPASVVRRFAAQALGKVGDSSAAARLNEALNDEDDSVRAEAKKAIEEITRNSIKSNTPKK